MLANFFSLRVDGVPIYGKDAVKKSLEVMRGGEGVTLASLQPLVTFGWVLSADENKEVAQKTRDLLGGANPPSSSGAASSGAPPAKKAKKVAESKAVDASAKAAAFFA